MEVNKKLYESYIKEITPVHSRLANMGRAFLCGGLVCLLGQAVADGLTAAGLGQEGAAHTLAANDQACQAMCRQARTRLDQAADFIVRRVVDS